MSDPVSQGSIRRRLLVSLLLGAAVLSVLLYFTIQTVARQAARESQDNILAASALSILDSARFSGAAFTVDLPYAALSMLDNVTDERVFYAIRFGDELLTGYSDLPEPPVLSIGPAAFLSTTYKGDEVRVATVRRAVSADAGRGLLQVSVAQTLSGQRQTLSRISLMSVGIGVGFFLLTALFAVVIARSTIRPLDRLTVSVSRRGPKDLRPVAAPVPSEMVPLVASLNGFMSRLQSSLTRSEEFIAEAAHRVRTPLAIVRTKAEIIQRTTSDPETHQAVTEMMHAIDDSSRTAGQLLDHAMVAVRLDDLIREELDLGVMVRESIERIGPVSDLKSIEIKATLCECAHLQGDGILIQNALHNLLDNSIKYAPQGAMIHVDVSTDEDGISLAIRDNGPGFAEDEPDALIGRFARGANAEGTIGSGLGLTIVHDVVAAHGGRMSIKNNSGGGACVSLHFPAH